MGHVFGELGYALVNVSYGLLQSGNAVNEIVESVSNTGQYEVLNFVNLRQLIVHPCWRSSIFICSSRQSSLEVWEEVFPTASAAPR